MHKDDENNIKLIQINKDNSLRDYSDQDITNAKMILYENLSSLEDNISKDNLRSIEKLIPELNDDLIKSNMEIIKKIKEGYDKTKNKKDFNNIITPKDKNVDVLIEELGDEIGNAMEFTFSLPNIIKLSSILYYSFKDIDKRSGIKNSETFDLFLEDQNYFSKRKYSHNSDDTKEEKSFLPLELYDLIECLQLIKKLVFVIPDTLEFDINIYILALLNLDWLFPNTLEVVFDNSNCLLHGLIENKNVPYFEQLRDHKGLFILILLYPYFISKIENLSSLVIILQDSYQAEIDYIMKNLNKVYFNDFHLFDLLILTVNLSTIEIEFNCLDSNTFERFLWLIHKNNSLRFLKIKFFPTENNCENFYKSRNLTKLCSLLNIELKNLSILTSSFAFDQDFDNGKKTNTNNINSAIDDVEYIINCMILKFERNMEKFFFIFTGKFFLNSLSLNFELPSVITDKYITVFQKFIFDIFININSKGKSLQSIEISSTNFPFDSRMFNSIKKFIEKFDLNNNRFLLNFTFNVRLHNIDFSKFFTRNLEYIELGELDSSSFNYLIKSLDLDNNKHDIEGKPKLPEKFHSTPIEIIDKHISGKKKTSHSMINNLEFSLQNLEIIKLTISSLLFNYESSKEDLKYFFTMKKPKKLKRIDFISRIPLLDHELKEILDIIKYDSMCVYNLEFSKKNIVDEKSFEKYKLYYYLVDKSQMLNIMYSFVKLKCISKKNSYKNIFKNIANFLKVPHEKRFTINFN